ncbi:hypothetical protein PHYC_00649 [Phycisphaerales bacterium]|nr:hypothetical protein PHYC_00649 [Phycisphaerales bacterium]
MGLDFAIDALYQTGWNVPEPKDLPLDASGRPYPSQAHIEAAFAEHALALSVRHIQLFDCYRAEWRDAGGQARGAVVGQTAEEAAVYAFSQLRRQLSESVA